MKTPALPLILLGIILTSCQNPFLEEKSNELNPKTLFELSRHSKKFKFQNLESFAMDTLEWTERAKHFHKLTRDEFFSVYQDTTIKYYGGYEESIEIDCFYSVQKRNSNFQEVTVLWQREGTYCDGITYFIFSKGGKLIAEFPVAGSCGDGGYFENSYGQFTNDTTYQLLIEDNYKTEKIEDEQIITKTEKLFTISKGGAVNGIEKVISVDTITY